MHQWYEEDNRLFELEIEAMKRIYPDENYVLPDKRLCWCVNVHLSDGDWTLICVYRYKYPFWGFGYSITVYPVKPNFDEMK